MPAQLHNNLELLFNAGLLPTSTVGEPGAQGAVVTGKHGCGVSTPKAAAVAAATIGLAIDWHMPKGNIFIIGLLSIMLAMGIAVIVLFIGSTVRLEGDVPKEH